MNAFFGVSPHWGTRPLVQWHEVADMIKVSVSEQDGLDR